MQSTEVSKTLAVYAMQISAPKRLSQVPTTMLKCVFSNSEAPIEMY